MPGKQQIVQATRSGVTIGTAVVLFLAFAGVAGTVSATDQTQVSTDAEKWSVSEPSGDAVYQSTTEQSQTDAPVFHIENIETNAPIAAGENLTATITITNDGSDVGRQKIHLKDNRNIHDETWVWLRPGESKSISLYWNTDESDFAYDEITVTSTDDIETQSVTITPPGGELPGFQLDVTDTYAVDGQGVAVDATVTNDDPEGKWQVIYAEDDGTVVDREVVWLWGRDSKSVSLRWDSESTPDEISVTGEDDTTTGAVDICTGEGTDTSGDGLTDCEERVYGTDPTEPDTTGDGLADYEQVHDYGTDPSVNDTTGDGLTDYDEIHEYGTDPTEADTNGDGLTDYEQIYDHGTDPTKNDTAGNGLTDYEEVRVHGSDPSKNDTSGDGLTDYEQVTDPHLSASDPAQYDVFVEVNYRGIDDESEIKDALRPVQQAFADAPIDNPDGSTGINLHIVMDDEISDDKELDLDVEPSYRDYRDSKYHVMAVDLTGGDTSMASYGRGITYADSADRSMARIFMHEFGHSLGLGAPDYEGIDSTDISPNKYESIMNYRYMWETNGMDFNSGEPFDDWAFIEDGYTPTVGGGTCSSDPFWCPVA